MELIGIEDLEDEPGPSSAKRRVGDAVGCEQMALNYYELEPGESFAFGYHSHSDQEELFYILEGVATFETEDGELEVSADELLYFAPGEYQRGVNKGSGKVVAIAVGAPAEMGQSEILRECSDCDERTPQRLVRDDEIITECINCESKTGRFEAG